MQKQFHPYGLSVNFMKKAGLALLWNFLPERKTIGYSPIKDERVAFVRSIVKAFP